MTYLKGFAVGVSATLLYVVLVAAVLLFIQNPEFWSDHGGVVVGISVSRVYVHVAVAAVIFVLGFYWQVRRQQFK